MLRAITVQVVDSQTHFIRSADVKVDGETLSWNSSSQFFVSRTMSFGSRVAVSVAADSTKFWPLAFELDLAGSAATWAPLSDSEERSWKEASRVSLDVAGHVLNVRVRIFGLKPVRECSDGNLC